jgi:hypothetical protein
MLAFAQYPHPRSAGIALSLGAFCNFHGLSSKVHRLVTANCRDRSRQPAEVRAPKHEIRSPVAVNRSKSAIAALLLTGVIAAPAAAQQAPLTPPLAMSEFCSGCFGYLEFPPLPEELPASSLAYTHQDTAAATRAEHESPIGPRSARQPANRGVM